MRVSGNHDLAIRLREIEQRGLQVLNKSAEIVDRRAQPESKVSRHLIVATASGVQFPAEVAGGFDQFRFDKRVNVLRGGVTEISIVSASLFENGLQRVADLASFGRGQDTCVFKRAAVRDAGGHVRRE